MLNEYRTITGIGNNQTNISYGSVNQAFLRLTPYDYADGIHDPSGADRPSAREVSNGVFAQNESIPNSVGVSDLFWLWGQFIDHDIGLTPDTTNPFPIAVSLGDPYFDPFNTGVETIPLNRSDVVEGTGETTPGDQYNEITAYLDASMVYGSDPDREAFLRDEGGKLKVTDGDFLPYNDGSFNNAPNQATNLFLAGDIRANENVGLTSLHTLFVREHNRIVDDLAQQHPEYNAETLYQEAKAIVEAEIQSITYNEFIPLLLGPNALSDYQGYNPTIDPQIANIFATAAYRFGHSMLSSQLLRVDESGNEVADGNLALRDAFFRPDKILNEGGIDPILRGAATQVAQTIDTKIVDEVRNFLFGPPGSGGLDLAALNVQRGRDHGLADYNSARVAYGLDPVNSFAEITSDVDLQQQLEDLFGNVDNIDVFVGGLAEDPVPGSMLGELFYTALVDQFTRIRDGDRFFYETRFDQETVDTINNTTLSAVILRNTDINYMQANAMIAYQRMDGNDENNHMMGNDVNNLMMAHAGNDNIDGGKGNDQIYGDAGEDTLSGNDGDDMLLGGDDRDMLKGGDGNDMLLGGDDRDQLIAGNGDDYLMGDSGSDRLYGKDGNDTLLGGDGNDKLSGDNGNDVLVGGQGNDSLSGGNGDDNLSGDQGNDTLCGDDGNDILNGGDGNDYVVGGNGNDILHGGNGNDHLYGDRGDDIIIGDAGNDTLAGGSGNDVFKFSPGTGHDYIQDMHLALTPNGEHDKIDLSDFGLSYEQITMSSVGHDVNIDLGSGDLITVSHIATPQLLTEDFFIL